MDAHAMRRASHATAQSSQRAWDHHAPYLVSTVLHSSSSRLPRSPRSAHHGRGHKLQTCAASTTTIAPDKAPDKAQAYNESMSRSMGWDHLNPYEYHPERGLYYHEVYPNLLCGSQPQTPADIERLHSQERVTNIVNLQEDKDFAFWGVDFVVYQRRAEELGMFLDRRPIVDFDGQSLRRCLPRIVKTLQGALSAGGRVYVHCTAGLGRAPAVCIAWRYWYGGLQLDEAYSALTAIRPCGPKREAIRGATFDLLDSRGFGEFEHLPSDAYAFLNERDRARLHQELWSRS